MSFKQLIKDGTIKRKDGLRADWKDISPQAGFNTREHREALAEHIASIAQHLINGGNIPALEVRISSAGELVLVDGYSRHAAIGQAVEHFLHAGDQARADELMMVDIVPFKGTEAEAVARIATSNENLKLTPLELARTYGRMRDFGLQPDEIAKAVGKTRQHVDQMLTLHGGTEAVKDMIRAGKIAAAEAVKHIRNHGDNAEAVIGELLGKAEANGKRKVTAGTVKARPLPRVETEAVIAAVDRLAESVSNEARAELLASLNSDGDEFGFIPARVLIDLLTAAEFLADARRASDAAAAAKAAKESQQEIPA